MAHVHSSTEDKYHDRLLDEHFNGNPVKQFNELFDEVFQDFKPTEKVNGKWVGEGFQVWEEAK